jgi:hypothetical protein
MSYFIKPGFIGPEKFIWVFERVEKASLPMML